MKLVTTVMAGALALAAVGSANAQTQIVRYTGSTAYRSAVQAGILAAFDTTPAYGWVGAAGSTLGGANQSIFSGTMGGIATVIATDFTGSEAGIQAVAGNNAEFAVPFLNATDTTLLASLNTSGVILGTTAGADNEIPDVAMSDTWQSSSQFSGGSSSTISRVKYTYATLNDAGPVGIVPFKWVASQSATFTNITSQLVRSTYQNGGTPMSVFTGIEPAAGSPVTYVYPLGRNPDSGTRLTAFLESGLGNTSATVTQWQPVTLTNGEISTTGTTISSFIKWPTDTVNKISVVTGNSGYSSGGQLAAVLSDPVSSSVTNYGAMIGYCGVSDIDPYLTTTATNSGYYVQELKYNGVALGNAGGNYNNVTSLIEGQYTFWSYEHMYYRTGAPTAVTNVVSAVSSQVENNTAVVFLDSMKVNRSGDGADVVHN